MENENNRFRNFIKKIVSHILSYNYIKGNKNRYTLRRFNVFNW